MTMKCILLGGFLGLLAAVLSTPVNATMGIPDIDTIQEFQQDGHILVTPKAVSDSNTMGISYIDTVQEFQQDGHILVTPKAVSDSNTMGISYIDTVQEFQQDGYILVTPKAVSDSSAQSSTSITTASWTDQHLPVSLTELVKISPTIKASQQPFMNDMEDDSADDASGSGQFTTTESSVSYTQTSAFAKKSMTFASTTDESSKMSMTVQTSQQPSTNVMEVGSADDESGSGYITATDSSTSHTTTTTSTTESTTTKIFGSDKTQTSQEPSTVHIIEGSSETTSPAWVHGRRRIVIAPDLSTLPTPTSTSTTAPVKDEITYSLESESTTASQALLVPLEEEIIQEVHVNNIKFSKEDSDATSTATQVQSQNADKQKDKKFHKGNGTPDWIIILGFVVGVAALVALCAAIATRDKWNGPNQALETKTNSSNKKRELETQAFLYKEEPKENGKAAEYTVIPLDDLPEGYSLH